MVADPLVSFSEACGLIGALKVHIEGAGAPGPAVLDDCGPSLVVGRSRIADVRIDDPQVSGRHAYFQVVAGRIFCVDLGSRAGVEWGDGRRPAGWVDPSRGVVIGPARVRFECEGTDGQAPGTEGNLPISRSFRWPDLPEASLEFVGEGTDRAPWQVSRALVLLGRSAVCRLRLSGPGVAGVHAALLRTPSGIWAVDLRGPGGITVGGRPIRHARLADGDEIGLGSHRIRVRFGRADLVVMPGGRETGPGRGDSAPGGRELVGSADPTMAGMLDEFRRMHRATTEQFQQAILMMFRMHQDQMDLIRDELSRLDRLEDELKALQGGSDRVDRDRTPRVRLRLVSDKSPPPSAGPGHGPAESGPLEGPAPVDRRPREEASSPAPAGTDAHAQIARRIAEITGERQGLWRKILATLSVDGPDRGVL